jgi:geranylgeranyl pyrophosphate synthase
VLHAITAEPQLTEILGRQLDWAQVERALPLVTAGDAIETSLALARTHATKATEALSGAAGLDADVCQRMRALVEGLVRRSS